MSMESAESQGGVAAGELRQFIERVERLEEEKAALQDDIKDVMAQPDLVDRYRNLGYAPMHLTPDGFEARIATEIKAWSKIISDARIHLD